MPIFASRPINVDFPEPGGPVSTSAGLSDANHARMRDCAQVRSTKAELPRAVMGARPGGSMGRAATVPAAMDRNVDCERGTRRVAPQPVGTTRAHAGRLGRHPGQGLRLRAVAGTDRRRPGVGYSSTPTCESRNACTRSRIAVADGVGGLVIASLRSCSAASRFRTCTAAISARARQFGVPAAGDRGDRLPCRTSGQAPPYLRGPRILVHRPPNLGIPDRLVHGGYPASGGDEPGTGGQTGRETSHKAPSLGRGRVACPSGAGIGGSRRAA